MNWEVVNDIDQAKIKVIGVGGAGGNAVIHMMNHKIQGVEFICANTDSQALENAKGATILKLGGGMTKGLGAGANPEVGRQAAERDREAIEQLLHGSDMIFITAGMGGGTGTGAAPVIASIAKELGALTVAVVTKPFKFEGKPRMSSAEKGLAALVEEVDSLITIPNQKLIDVLGANTPIPVMGTGRSNTKDRGRDAAELAVGSELLEDINLKDARGVLVNISAKDPTMGDFTEVSEVVEEFTADDATCIYGLVIDPSLKDELMVTIVATGVNQKSPKLAIDNKPRASIKLSPVGLDKDLTNKDQLL